MKLQSGFVRYNEGTFDEARIEAPRTDERGGCTILSDTQALISSYLTDLTNVIASVHAVDVDALVDRLAEAWENDRHVLLMGNGGSSSTVSHIVADLQKNVFLHCGRAMRTICLTDSAPLLTAWGNDTRYDNVFAGQVECWAKPGDLVIAVSGSGNSPNIIHGIEAANRLGAVTFGLAGFGGGKLKDSAQACIVLDCHHMQLVEDVHMSILHAAFLALIERIAPGQ